jgi:hypothetical protein
MKPDYTAKKTTALLLLGALFQHKDVKKSGPQHIVNGEIAFTACKACFKNVMWMKICFIAFLIVSAIIAAMIKTELIAPITTKTIFLVILSGVAFGLFVFTGARAIDWLTGGGLMLRKTGATKSAKAWLPIRKFLIERGLVYHLVEQLFPHQPGLSDTTSEERAAEVVIADIAGWTERQNKYPHHVNRAFKAWAISLAKAGSEASKKGDVATHKKNDVLITMVINIADIHFGVRIDKLTTYQKAS